MIKKKNKFLKQLVLLFAVLLLFVTLTGSITGLAVNKPFGFDIPKNGGLTHTTDSYKRNTSQPNNAWMVQFDYSDEGISQYNTRTLFWLGIDNPNGINPMGSEKNQFWKSQDQNILVQNPKHPTNMFIYMHQIIQISRKHIPPAVIGIRHQVLL